MPVSSSNQKVFRWAGAATFLAFAFGVGGGNICRAQTGDVGHQIAAELQAGKFAEAKSSAERALEISPRDARLWTFKGVALAELGLQEEALATFTRALEIAPRYLPALEGAAQVEFQVEPGRAVPILKRILEIRPGDEASRKMLAQIAFSQGDCDVGRKDSAAVSVGTASEAAALKQFGSCLLKAKKWNAAVAVFEQYRRLQPGSQADYALGVAQFLAGRFVEVVKTLEPVAARGEADADTLELLAEAYDLTGEPARAVLSLKAAIAAKPDTVAYYTDFAYMCQAHGWFQQGIETVNAGLARLPKSASLYVARGVLYSELADWARGEADFQTANEIDPNVEFGATAQGLAELQQNDLKRAEKNVRERLRQHANDAFLNYLLSEILAKQGAAPGSPVFAEALSKAKEAVALKPDLLLARDLLGRLYLEQGDTEKSIEQSRVALRANPTDQMALYHLILALRKSGKSSEIPDLLRQLAQLKEHSRKQNDLERTARAVFPEMETPRDHP